MTLEIDPPMAFFLITELEGGLLVLKTRIEKEARKK